MLDLRQLRQAVLVAGADALVADLRAASPDGKTVLASGVILTAGYIPFTWFLHQTGHPAAQSLLLGMIALTSVTLNLVLVPLLGTIGAAIGTAAAQASLILYVRNSTRRRLGFAL